MAIKITDGIITEFGATNELYINIASVQYDKDIEDVLINVNVYKNEADRLEGKRCRTFVIPRSFSTTWSMEEMIDNAFVVAYRKLTEELNKNWNTEEI